MDTMKDTTMQHVTDVTIVPKATAEFIAGLLERIERLEKALANLARGYKSVPYAQWPTEIHEAFDLLGELK